SSICCARELEMLNICRLWLLAQPVLERRGALGGRPAPPSGGGGGGASPPPPRSPPTRGGCGHPAGSRGPRCLALPRCRGERGAGGGGGGARAGAVLEADESRGCRRGELGTEGPRRFTKAGASSSEATDCWLMIEEIDCSEAAWRRDSRDRDL